MALGIRGTAKITTLPIVTKKQDLTTHEVLFFVRAHPYVKSKNNKKGSSFDHPNCHPLPSPYSFGDM